MLTVSPAFRRTISVLDSAGEIQDFTLVERQRVVAAAGDVDCLDIDDAIVANGG